MIEDLIDYGRILDEGNNFHFSATLGALQWVYLIHLLNQHGPSFV